LHEHLQRQVHWKTIGLRLLIGSCLLAVVVWFGRHAVEDIEAVETWIAGHGVWGWVAFVGMVVLFTSMFVPDILLAVVAGSVFGIGWGTVLTFVGVVLTAVLNFLIARTLLRSRIEKMLEKHPKLRAIQRAAKNEGLRLQLLLRLAPLNAVSVSYVLGASGVRFSTFLLATVVVFVEVYFGYLANHVTTVAGNVNEHSTLHTVVTVVGFVVCVVLMIYIARVASRAIAETEIDSAVDRPNEEG